MRACSGSGSETPCAKAGTGPAADAQGMPTALAPAERFPDEHSARFALVKALDRGGHSGYKSMATQAALVTVGGSAGP